MERGRGDYWRPVAGGKEVLHAEKKVLWRKKKKMGKHNQKNNEETNRMVDTFVK